MNQPEGLAIARVFREALRRRGYPVRRVVLFGSVARNRATADSDIDIAVICEPFADSRHEENMALRRVRRDIDVRIEPVALHEEDFTLPSSALPREIERTGIVA